MLTAAQIPLWMAAQSWPDVRPVGGEPSFLHTYGFVVVRLPSPRIDGWNVRLHLWNRAHRRPPWAGPGAADLLVHSHGWEVRTRTLVGAVRHTSYAVVPDGRDTGHLYGVVNDYAAGTSRLTKVGDGVSLRELDSHTAAAGSPVTVVPRGAFHTTTADPGHEWSATIVVTENAAGSDCGQVWSAGDLGAGSENSRRAVPDLAALLDEVDAVHRGAPAQRDDWVSFAVIVVGDAVLLARTYRYPEVWQPIGGHGAESDAEPADTVVREVAEEIGLRVDRAGLEFLAAVERDRGPGRMYVWRVDLPARPVLHPLAEEIIELAWFPLSATDGLPMLPATRAVVRSVRDAAP